MYNRIPVPLDGSRLSEIQTLEIMNKIWKIFITLKRCKSDVAHPIVNLLSSLSGVH